MLANCSSSDQGCWMRRRLATTEGCSAAAQKRKVEIICRRRERSSRYKATETAATAPKTARNCASDRLRKYMSLPSGSGDSAHTNQISKHDILERLRGSNPCIPAATAQSQPLKFRAIFVEGQSISRPCHLVDIHPESRAGLSLPQIQFPKPGWRAILIRPDLQKH